MYSAVLGAFLALGGDFRAWPHVPDPTGFLVWRSSCDPQLQAAWLWAFSSQTLAFLAWKTLFTTTQVVIRVLVILIILVSSVIANAKFMNAATKSSGHTLQVVPQHSDLACSDLLPCRKRRNLVPPTGNARTRREYVRANVLRDLPAIRQVPQICESESL